MTPATRSRHDRNLHVPLSAAMHERLRKQATNLGRPATVLARDAIDRWLVEQERAAVHAAISEYARAAAGTDHDLDPDLEVAAVAHLLAPDGRKRKARRA